MPQTERLRRAWENEERAANERAVAKIQCDTLQQEVVDLQIKLEVALNRFIQKEQEEREARNQRTAIEREEAQHQTACRCPHCLHHRARRPVKLIRVRGYVRAMRQ